MENKFVHPDTIIPDKTYMANGVKVNQYFIKDHNINNLTLPSKRAYQLKGVTIHNTTTLGKDDDAKWYVCSTENGNMGGVFVNAYVDYNGAWQELPWDSMNWSCSDGIDYAGGNAATIAIEAIMDSPNGSNNLKAMDNAARLAAYLLWSNNLTANDLYTHSYWINTKIYNAKGDRDYLNTLTNPRKNCPVYIIPQWDSFKKSVDAYIVKLGGKSIYTPTEKGTPVNYIYQATSTAAIRPEMSKSSEIYGRVTKGNYYCADTLYPDSKNPEWFKYTGQSAYSMLYDGGYLFKKVGNYTTKVTAARVNVREKPNFNGKVITTLPSNTLVYVWNAPTTKANGYTWCKIVYNGKTAYMVTAYLK